MHRSGGPYINSKLWLYDNEREVDTQLANYQ